MKTCPYPGCGVPINPGQYLCRGHFAGITDQDRLAIIFNASRVRGRKMTARAFLDDLSARLARYAKPELAGVDRKQLVKVALAFEAYLAKDDEYRKCKEQFVDQKKKLGTEHRKLRAIVDALLREILRPEQVQPALFDNSPDKPPPARLPD